MIARSARGGVLQAVRLLGLSLVLGCTATKAGVRIVGAETALSRARAEQADLLAPYEYTLAEQYLIKAREEVAASEYRIADALAASSAEWADRSVITLKGRRTPDIRLEEVPTGETPLPPPPADAPVPTPDDDYDDFDKPDGDDEVDIGGPK